MLYKQKEDDHKRIKSEPDFYVGENGKILSAKYKNWIGVSRRDRLLKKARNALLKNAINQLYRPKSFIGDGGTASVVLFERKTKISLGKNGGNHIKKAKEMIVYIERKVLTQHLSNLDEKIERNLIKKLRKAMVK